MNRPYSEATVEAVAAAIADARDDDVFSDSEWNGSHWEGNRDQYRGDARAALDALAVAGLLLPEGVETRTEYGVRHSYPGDEPITIPATNHVMAAQAVARPSGRRLALMERNTWSSPWVEVDAVRLAESDTKPSQDHAQEPDHAD